MAPLFITFVQNTMSLHCQTARVHPGTHIQQHGVGAINLGFNAFSIAILVINP